jgi:hypothetical protein
MQNLNPDEQQHLQNELNGDESLLWAGKPNTPVFVDIDDAASVYAIVADLRARPVRN